MSLSDVAPTLRARLCQAYGWRDDEQLPERLEEAGFLTTERGGSTALTVAGALLLLADPQKIGGRPYIDVRRYAEGEPDPDKV